MITNFKVPKIRSPLHLAFVRSQPCVITKDNENCCRKPVDPHHLMKMGGRGAGLKESDMWTIPLCRKHHIEVTGYGDEEVFWVFHNKPYEYVIGRAIALALRSPDEAVREAMRRWELNCQEEGGKKDD